MPPLRTHRLALAVRGLARLAAPPLARLAGTRNLLRRTGMGQALIDEQDEQDPRGWCKDGYHRDRWWYSFPWRQTDWWRPRWGWGSDEYCNPTWYLITPLGEIVVRYRRGPISRVEDSCDVCKAFNSEPPRFKDWGELLAATVHQWPKSLPLKVTVWPCLHPFSRGRDVQIHGVGWTMTWRKRRKDWDPAHVEYMVRDYLRCLYGDSLRGMALLRLDVEWKEAEDVVPAEP